MVHKYIVPEYPWFLEPTTYALFGIALGYVSPSKLFTIVVYLLCACAGIMNYLYLLPGHKFTWVGNIKTFNSNGNMFNCTIVAPDGVIDPKLSLFTQEDIGKLSMIVASFILLSITLYDFKMRIFSISTIRKFDKSIDIKKAAIYFIFTLLQFGWIPPVFQFLSWKKIQQVSDNVIIPFNVISVLLVGTAWFFAFGITWFYWIWPEFVDKKRKVILSKHYKNKKFYYLIYQICIWLVVVIYMINHIIAIYPKKFLGHSFTTSIISAFVFGFYLIILLCKFII